MWRQRVAETYLLRNECKAAFTSEREQNANAACENDANIRCRHIPEARQTAFGCVTNVWRTAKCYPSTVSTSKGIRIQYVYEGRFAASANAEQSTDLPAWTYASFSHAAFVYRCKPALRNITRIVRFKIFQTLLRNFRTRTYFLKIF